MQKTIDTLLDDMKNILKVKEHKPSSENIQHFLDNVKHEVIQMFEAKDHEAYLRMSNLGRPDRFLWFEMNKKTPSSSQDNSFETRLKFVVGHILEHLILLLAKEAGHSVTDQQKEVEIDGVKGHIDAKIDGIPVDAKTTSDYAFKKFSTGSILRNKDEDVFGYVGQISAYSHAEKASKAGFLAINRNTCQTTYLPVTEFDFIDIPERIAHLKVVTTAAEPPKEKCYEPVPEGLSGNMTLNKNCTFCSHIKDCWGKDLRAFKYSTGVKYFTTIKKQPSVEEVFI